MSKHIIAKNGEISHLCRNCKEHTVLKILVRELKRNGWHYYTTECLKCHNVAQNLTSNDIYVMDFSTENIDKVTNTYIKTAMASKPASTATTLELSMPPTRTAVVINMNT